MLTAKEIKEHDIQLSASAILLEHEKRQEAKKKKPFSWKIFFAVASPLAASAVIIPIVLVSLRPSSSAKPQIQDVLAVGEGERISNAVVSGVYLLPSLSQSSGVLSPKLQQAISRSDFIEVVGVYEKSDALLAKQLSSTPESYQKAENAPYDGVYGSYVYQIKISGSEELVYHFNYTKEDGEVSFKGEVAHAGVTYQIEGKNEVEGDESEYAYTVSLDSQNYLKIEEEKETGEYAYQYTLVQNGVEQYVLTYEKEEEVSLSFLLNGKSFAYEIASASALWSIAYKTAANEGTMSLERTATQKIYTDLASQQTVIK
jgi:hypothetical protein